MFTCNTYFYRAHSTIFHLVNLGDSYVFVDTVMSKRQIQIFKSVFFRASQILIDFKNLEWATFWWELQLKITIQYFHKFSSLFSLSLSQAQFVWKRAMTGSSGSRGVERIGFFAGSFTCLATGQTGQTNTAPQKAQRAREWAPPAPATTDSAELHRELWLNPVCCLFLIRPFSTTVALQKTL